MIKISAILLTFMSFNLFAANETFVQIEGSLLYQARNDQRIPGVGGTQFDLSDFDQGPFKAFRLYLGKIFNESHELRLLYAPLEINLKVTLPGPVQFNGSTFNTCPADAFYKFNSYRITYAYHFNPIQKWQLALGGSAKIRHAEVRLSQNGVISSKKNIGFVPLLNFQALRPIGENWNFHFDFDGLAAPQGRAFDTAVFMEYKLQKYFSILGGYRMVEGGADNDKVFNFALLHYVTLGLRGSFF